jgi:uncharacterized protein (TIGR03435 family)
MRARLSRVLTAILAAACLLNPARGRGQSPDGTATLPQFEVASVKPAPPYVPGQDASMRGGPGTDDLGQFTDPRDSLAGLLAAAYGVARDQISGPDWISTELYNVAAKIPPNTTKEQFRLMLQGLLVERFHLAVHHETREFQVYDLEVAKGGPKMKASTPNADAAPQASADEHRLSSNGFAVLPPGARVITLTGMGEIYGLVRSTHRETMAQFVEHLGAWINMSNGDGIVRGSPPAPHVFDKTGLTGEFEFTLEFAGSVFSSSSPPEPGLPGVNDWPGSTLFAALEKQLGLRLEKRKAGLDVVVVDRADRVPTAN